MSENANSEGISAENEKPVIVSDVKFPPFPEPTDDDFEEDIGEEERFFYKSKFPDINVVKSMRLHCSSCDRHLGSSTRNDSRMRAHPMLRTLVCQTCHTFYNSGEFEKGDDGSELYCRWCGQGGQVYCCSDCPHVFCAKCIKRNLGMPKIKEIENTDDWKCFKCNPRCLWDLRAVCWALLRYCDLKNKITYKTDDAELKEAYQKDCALDHTECCKNKSRRKDKSESKTIKRESDTIKRNAGDTNTNSAKKTNFASIPNAMSKIPSTIQVKKFASINLDESHKEKKPQKRPASPNKKPVIMKNPIPIAPNMKVFSPVGMPPLKKIRMPPMQNTIRMTTDKKQVPNSYSRIRPRMPTLPIPIMPTQFNGFNNHSGFNNNSGFTSNSFSNMMVNDTLNLSLESLTQGLDMASVSALSNNPMLDDDVVCTPDFPLEPLCEVTEDNTDDDVQCMTPVPVAASKVNTQPPMPRVASNLPEISSDNIIQMTENDVTVNALTGGLKFRVDPQTLSSNKMYRLPDGRIFAINANPNMPGGYSATIVAVTETPSSGKVGPKGATYAAKLSAVSSAQTSTPNRTRSNDSSRASTSKRSSSINSKVTRGTDTTSRNCDLHVPVEWYRYNLIDAVDALEYSLSRLNRLKKEATTMFLRTRTVEEMKSLHRTLERLLNTSSTRFNEIRDNLNKELRQYLVKKAGGQISDDDDDVEILPDLEENDDPIFIDENSVESTTQDLRCNENPEVDLTGVGSSDHNESGEMKNDSESSNYKNQQSSENEGSPKNNDNVANEVHTLINDVEAKENDQNEKFCVDSPESPEVITQTTDANDEVDCKKDENNPDAMDISDHTQTNEDGDTSENMDEVVEKLKEEKKSEEDEQTKKGEHKEKSDQREEGELKTEGELKEIGDHQEESQLKELGDHQQEGEPKELDDQQESELKEKGDHQEEGEYAKEKEQLKDVIHPKKEQTNEDENKILSDDNSNKVPDTHDKTNDSEMSEDMIESLLKDDVDAVQNDVKMEISDDAKTI